MVDEAKGLRCGFVALIGAPNAGKSTLLNALVRSKVSIVSPKVQTTRARVLGIGIHGDSQVVYIDTPGIFAPKRRLERAMVRAAWAGASDADLRVLLIDAARVAPRKDRGKDGREDEDVARILEGLREAGGKAILALNKIDRIKPQALLALAERYGATGLFDEIFMISALTGDGVADLRDHLAAQVPAGPWHYPEDQVADMPMRLLASEITREKLFLQLHEELPYALTVETEDWQERKDGSARIAQVIYVRRENQKAIVLGRGGARIKEIGAAARKDLETMLDRRIHLFLFVKVRENWVDDPARYREMGLDFES
ncbi:MAG: GTPase Era [Rhodospirillaceae bacterium]|jgi:GTPase|nr:GTPase Era [Rhodospirillaceae bacterium]